MTICTLQKQMLKILPERENSQKLYTDSFFYACRYFFVPNFVLAKDEK